MKKSNKKTVAAAVVAPVVAAPVIQPVVVQPFPQARGRKGNGFDIDPRRVISAIDRSKGNPYLLEAQRDGMESKAGDKYRAFELAQVGMTLGQWRAKCTEQGIALFAGSGATKKMVMFRDPDPTPEEVAAKAAAEKAANKATREAAKALVAKTGKKRK